MFLAPGPTVDIVASTDESSKVAGDLQLVGGLVLGSQGLTGPSWEPAYRTAAALLFAGLQGTLALILGCAVSGTPWTLPGFCSVGSSESCGIARRGLAPARYSVSALRISHL